MKNSFKKVLSGMLMASTASIASANPDMNISNIVNDMLSSGKKISVSNSLNRKLQKYIIKFGNGGAYVVAGHQSHRSHSSHRSHRSSSGSYYGGSSSSSSRTTSTRQASPATSNTKSNATTTKKSNSQSPVASQEVVIDNGNYIFRFGDRILQVGCIGTDVKVLNAYLRKYGCLDEKEEVNSDGYSVFTTRVEEGVKKFQKKFYLPVTGIVDKTTIKALK